MLEQAIISILSRHPEFIPSEQGEETTEVQDALQVEQAEEPPSSQNSSMTKESLSAINKTLSAFWNR